MRALLLLFVAAAGAVAAATMAGARAMPCDGSLLSPAVVPRLAEIARTNIGTEYPNLIHHTMQSDADVQPPRKLTPAFYGSYDWHSAVHSHWQLGTSAAGNERAVTVEALTRGRPAVWGVCTVRAQCASSGRSPTRRSRAPSAPRSTRT